MQHVISGNNYIDQENTVFKSYVRMGFITKECIVTHDTNLKFKFQLASHFNTSKIKYNNCTSCTKPPLLPWHFKSVYF